MNLKGALQRTAVPAGSRTVRIIGQTPKLSGLQWIRAFPPALAEVGSKRRVSNRPVVPSKHYENET